MSAPTPHDELELAAGAYVLGALSPADHAAFARHLPQCAVCRDVVEDLAGLPGLLSHVPAADVERLPADLVPLPAQLLDDLLREVRRHRRRRRLAVAAVAAVVAAVLALAGVLVSRPAASPVGQAMTSLAPATLTARVTLEPVAWGTRLTLVCRYADRSRGPVPYALVVVGRDGRSEQVGTWTAVPGVTTRMAAATSWRRDDIAAVEVRSSSGLAVLRLARPAGGGPSPSVGSRSVGDRSLDAGYR